MDHIRIIEVEDHTRHLLRNVLKQEGPTVPEGHARQERVSKYSENQAGIVVTDILVPRTDERETMRNECREVQARKIVVKTAAALKHSLRRMKEEGLFPFILKTKEKSLLMARCDSNFSWEFANR